MPEGFGPERGPESRAEGANHDGLTKAVAEEEALLREVDDILATATDRIAAERRIVEEYAPRISEAQQRSREALNRWIAELRKSE